MTASADLPSLASSPPAHPFGAAVSHLPRAICLWATVQARPSAWYGALKAGLLTGLVSRVSLVPGGFFSGSLVPHHWMRPWDSSRPACHFGDQTDSAGREGNGHHSVLVSLGLQRGRSPPCPSQRIPFMYPQAAHAGGPPFLSGQGPGPTCLLREHHFEHNCQPAGHALLGLSCI